MQKWNKAHYNINKVKNNQDSQHPRELKWKCVKLECCNELSSCRSLHKSPCLDCSATVLGSSQELLSSEQITGSQAEWWFCYSSHIPQFQNKTLLTSRSHSLLSTRLPSSIHKHLQAISAATWNSFTCWFLFSWQRTPFGAYQFLYFWEHTCVPPS